MLAREAYHQLNEWKRLKTQQGLLVTGARQVGKTTPVSYTHLTLPTKSLV